MPNAPWVICRWHITEEEIKAAFVTAFNKLVTERAGANIASRSCASTSASCASEEIAANARLVRQTLCDTTELEQEKASLQREASPFRGRGSSGRLRRRESLSRSSMSGSGARPVDYVTVGVDGGMAVVFQDGTGIKI